MDQSLDREIVEPLRAHPEDGYVLVQVHVPIKEAIMWSVEACEHEITLQELVLGVMRGTIKVKE